MTKILFKENQLKINDLCVIFDFPIQEIGNMGDIIIVLLDRDSNLRKWGQFPNLFGVSFDGKILWVSELPTTDTGDSYYYIELKNNYIHAYSVCSYNCIVDPNTGKIISKEFTK